jgi:hypothetical protein
VAPGGAPGLWRPLPGTALGPELEPLESVPPDATAVVVVVALALAAVDAIPPAMAPTPNKAIPLMTTLPGRRHPRRRTGSAAAESFRAESSCAGSSGPSCGRTVRLLSRALRSRGATPSLRFPPSRARSTACEPAHRDTRCPRPTSQCDHSGFAADVSGAVRARCARRRCRRRAPAPEVGRRDTVRTSH